MEKKIMVLNGSPRQNGNTKALIGEFTKGAMEAGHEVVCFDLQQMDIRGCLGCCKGGGDSAHPCVQRDDMDKIYSEYQQADVVVLASPMYYWGISGQLKTAFDRLFAVAELDANYKNPVKDCVLLMAAEGDSKENFEPVLHFYKALLKNIDWRDCGVVYAGGNMAAGEIAGKPQLEEAKALGASL